MEGKRKSSRLAGIFRAANRYSKNIVPVPQTSSRSSLEEGQTAEYATSSVSLSDVVAYTTKNMNKDKIKEKEASGSRMAEDRRSGGLVPASPVSTSSKGQASEFRTSSEDLMAIVQDTDRIENYLREMQGEQINEGEEARKMPVITQIERLIGKIKVKKKRVLEESDETRKESSAPLTRQGPPMMISSESIVISSESEEDRTQSGTSNKSKGGKKSRCKKRKPNSPKQRMECDAADEEIETHFSVESKSKLEQEIAGLEIAHATEVFARLQDWLEKIENMRKKSENIKGSWSGQMKIFLECCKKAGMVLSIKASSKNDPEYWKTRVENLKEENMALCCRVDSLEKNLQMIKDRNFIHDAYSGGDSPHKNSDSPKKNKNK